ncbi:hypothetical protein CV102_16900 [Natronococcus pandeyae]|uniref:Carboxypeptidase regulatory-like domain-containing protein n=1 Tax=Natronococcus pandeyae TaxID=2055836 RepID=A0A8J8Q0R1_9EURY|nr:carboxypeptidase-like regulatory domain-containing protein [Natronococcus pandeyae]TYL37306.1 hypothetical protein CV102_16900 [Natronococcus pandeyae]
MLKRTAEKSTIGRVSGPTRRRTLRILATAGLAGVAGCTGTLEEIDSGDDDESDDADGEDIDSNERRDDGSNDSDQNDVSEEQDDETDDIGNEDDSTTDDEPSDTESGEQDTDDAPTIDDESSDDEADETEDAGQDRSDPETAELTVRVIDDADNPVDGASLTLVPHLEEVEAPDHPIEHGETDVDGVYTDVLEHHVYTIEVEHPDYEFRVGEYTHDGPGEVTVPLKLVGDPDTTDASSVSITVVDAEDTPIEGAAVSLIPYVSDLPIIEGETDGDGVYTETIEERVYMLEVAHPDHGDYRREYIHNGPDEITITLEAGAGEPSITVTVTDEDGVPIEGATVELQAYVEEGEGASGETNVDGVFTASLDEIDYTIHVEHPDYEPEGWVINIPRDTQLTIELEPFRERADLTVTVVDSETDPIEGALVRLIGPDDDPVYDSIATGETDAEGVFTETVREDTYFIEVSHDDYERTEVTHEHVGPSETTVVLGGG